MQAEGPLVPFPLPKSGKTLTAVVPPSQDDSGLWSDDDDGFDDDAFEDDVRDLDELDVNDVKAVEAVEGHSERAMVPPPTSVPQDVEEEPAEGAEPPMVIVNVCSEACRAKLVVAVEEEKAAR